MPPSIRAGPYTQTSPEYDGTSACTIAASRCADVPRCFAVRCEHPGNKSRDSAANPCFIAAPECGRSGNTTIGEASFSKNIGRPSEVGGNGPPLYGSSYAWP